MYFFCPEVYTIEVEVFHRFDNIVFVDSSEETMEKEKENSSRKNQNPDENRPSDLDEGSLVRVGKRSKNGITNTKTKLILSFINLKCNL